MTDTFRPIAFGPVLASAIFLGIGNAILVAITAAIANFVVPHAHTTIGNVAGFATLAGVGTSVAIAMAERPMTYRQRTISPYGATVAFIDLALPLLVGSLAGWLVCGSRWFFTGALCTFLAYLVQFFILTPWKKSFDDDDVKARSKEFSKVTHQYIAEYKEDIGEITRQKAQRKHEKNQERLRKQRERR